MNLNWGPILSQLLSPEIVTDADKIVTKKAGIVGKLLKLPSKT